MPGTRAPWWMFVVAASFLAHYALLTYSLVWGVQRLGVNPEYTGGRMLLRDVASGSPAERAGLRGGDYLVALDGQVIHNLLDWDAVAANLEPGQPRKLEIERAGKRWEATVTLGRFSRSDWDATAWMILFGIRGAQLAMLLLAFVIAFSRPHDFVGRLGALFLAAGAVGWPVVPYGMAATWRHLPPLVGGLLWIAEVGAAAATPLFFTFFAIFPRPLFRARWAWALVWLPGLGVISVFILHYYRMVYQPGSVTGLPDWALPAILAVGGAYILSGLLALVANYRRLEDVNERRRMRVLVVGSVVGWPPLLAVTILSLLGVRSGTLASFFFSFPVLMIVVLLFTAFPLSFAYAILRHRLFDIRVIVRQSLQYALARWVVVSMLPAAVALFLLDVGLHRGDIGIIAIGDFFAHSPRGWVYVVIGVLALLAHRNRHKWLDALDRRFFRERYDAQRLLREVVEEVRQAEGFERVAPHVVARIEAALHPEFVALLVRDPREASYRSLASAPAGQAPPTFSAESKLVALVRLLGKPLEISLTETSWLKQQLPHEETDFLRRARIDLLVPVALAPGSREALLAVGLKRSEEPYTREDQDLLIAIASSLALLLERPVATPTKLGEALEECPQCGTCYETGMGHCPQEGASLTLVRLPRLLAGRYRLERRRGRGGMGAVYEATDTALERRVAVKVIRDDLVGSAEAAERFRREARAAAGFTHPNVVTVHDFGVAGDTRAFLVMELLDGKTLREELQKEKRLSAARMLGILQGVCDAVDAAHRRQLIHRDLKPENIFLAHAETTEVAKILDFGIAKFLPAATQATADTGTGALVGTVRYMAPEQLQGMPADPAWDLWAIAVVAYEMLTGAHPFADPNPGACQMAVLAGRFTPITAYFPDAPTGWQGFFARAFALERPHRPATARAFFSDLEHALG